MRFKFRVVSGNGAQVGFVRLFSVPAFGLWCS